MNWRWNDMPKTRRIKILRIQSRICIGGPAVHTEILSRYLPRDRFLSIVIGGAVDENESCRADELRSKGVDVRILDEMKRSVYMIRDLKSIYRLYRMIVAERPDIVETHTAKAGATGRIAAYLAGVPVIIHTFHGHVFNGYFGPVLTKLIILIEKLLAKISTKIIVLSASQQAEIVNRYKIAPMKKTAVIPLGFELERFLSLKKSSTLKQELKIRENNSLIAIIGRIVPIKNHEMILRVIEKLNAGDIQAHLAVVGDGALREKLEKVSNRKNVHFLGWRTDLENIYSGVDLVALTSYNEGTPLAVIEAMASGVPVVSTAVGGITDIISDGANGYTCKINDDEEMCKNIESILTDSELNSRLILHARESVIRNFTYQRLIRDMENMYHNVLLDTASC